MGLKAVFATVLVAIFYSCAGMAAEQQPLRDDQEIGFTHRLQHYSIGSKDVLIFETHSSFGQEGFGVTEENVDSNIHVMQKFLEWAKMAHERGDILNKDMAMVKGFDFGINTYWNNYQFETVKAVKDIANTPYFLKVTSGIKIFGLRFSPLNPDEPPQDQQDSATRTRVMSFDEDQVKQIIQRLQEFKEGKSKSAAEVARDYKM